MIRARLIGLAACCAAAAWGSAPAAENRDCINRPGDAALPRAAHYVSPAEAFHLQELLDRYRVIRLEPAADYRKAPALFLRSGYEVYGLAETRLPRVTVAAGTHDAVLSGVAPDGLVFEPSDKPIHHNCFERITTSYFDAPLTIANVIATGNSFVDIGPGAVRIDTREQGYLTNNRFIKLEMHAVSPALVVLGSRDRPSRGNVFLWTNLLTPPADSVIVEGQDDIDFVGLDAESWNWNHGARYPAMMNVRASGVVRLFMPHGGDNRWRDGRILDLDANQLELFGLRFGQAGDPAIVLHRGTLRVMKVISQTRSTEDDLSTGARLDVFPDFGPTVLSAGMDLAKSPVRPTQQDAIRKMLTDEGALRWPAPVLAPPRIPPGIVPADERARQRDSADAIQTQIDQRGIALLPAGVYYISRPLRLKNGQGVIGAGSASTAIVAMRPDIDLIVGADHLTETTTIRFALADVSLVGGHDGIRHDEMGSGRGAQYNHIVLSHVIFQHMSDAGIAIDTIHSWDNNFIDNVSFVDCVIGIKQTVPSWYQSGDLPGMTYLDKNVFYRTQFIGGKEGIHWVTKRANNLDMFVDSRFVGASERVVESANTDSMIFANVEFSDNAGDPTVVDNLPVGFVDSRFERMPETGSLLDDYALCRGCYFSKPRSSRASIGRRGAHVLLVSSVSRNVPLGDGVDGFLANSPVPETARNSQLLIHMQNGIAETLIPGPASPQLPPQVASVSP